MARNQTTKGVISSLPEAVQETLAEAALSKLKTRTRLEQLARGSAWAKLRWVLPIAVSLAILYVGGDLVAYLPILFIFIVFLIQSEVAFLHARMDALYRIMEADRESRAARMTPAAPPGRGEGDEPPPATGA